MALERAAWDQILATNLTGAFLCTKHAAQIMTSQQSGAIVNIASVYALTGPSKGLLGAYTASKHGLIGLTRANAVELAPLGIRVNAIAPGFHQTDMTAGVRDTAARQLHGLRLMAIPTSEERLKEKWPDITLIRNGLFKGPLNRCCLV
jgi:NAD(P)-dependent dehydrogenase (short-subunit alcohol dehydrogenase family)